MTVVDTRLNHLAIASQYAAAPEHWSVAPRFHPRGRWYHRLTVADDHEVWLLTWLPGQGTDLHDHGGSAGAFLIFSGTLTEDTVTTNPGEAPQLNPRELTEGTGRRFGPRHIHRVTNNSSRPAISIHVYSPALTTMTRYSIERGSLDVTDRRAGRRAVVSSATPVPPPGSVGIDEALAAARTRLNRLDPAETFAAVNHGAILVDIRPAAQRAEFGEIPGAIIIERNVLEWRLDPRCDARLPLADSYEVQVIVTCQEGYTSSLAAVALQDLGLHRATDLAGGFAAWRAAGLPTRG